jgi:transposase
MGTTTAFVEAEAPRVSCGKHGVVVARVPWARHDSRFTKDFEDQCAWLAVHVSKTTLAELLRVAWRTVGRIIGSVVEARSAEFDRLNGLRKIGIDEVSFRRGQRYLTVVVDHETARVVWVQEGRDEATLERFFDQLGPGRAAAVRFVTADGAEWIKNVLGRRCPQATVCLDPFHVVSWARHWTKSAERSGTRRDAPVRHPSRATSRGRATRCGRTPRISRVGSRRSSRTSPESTSPSTVPTCSRNSCARSFGCPSGRLLPCSTTGWRGRVGLACRPSCGSPARSVITRPLP